MEKWDCLKVSFSFQMTYFPRVRSATNLPLFEYIKRLHLATRTGAGPRIHIKLRRHRAEASGFGASHGRFERRRHGISRSWWMRTIPQPSDRSHTEPQATILRMLTQRF